MKSEGSGTDYLIDSNILIYVSKKTRAVIGVMSSLKSKGARVYVLWSTYVEALGYHKLTLDEKGILETVFRGLRKLDMNEQVARKAIELRQQEKIGLGDSIVAATAIVNGLCLVTHNARDFDSVDELNLSIQFHLECLDTHGASR